MAEFGPLRDSQIMIDAAFTRAMLLDGQMIVYRIQAADPPTMPALHCTLWSDAPLSPNTIAAAHERIAFALSLGDHLVPFYELAQGDPYFQPIVEQQSGYHQVKFPSAFENAIWAVLSQRNTLTSARNMRAALVKQYGAELTVEGQIYRAFPEPQRMADAPTGEIATVIGHAQKGPAVSAVAAAFAQVDERWLQVAPFEEVERWLLGIYGIGPWGASFVMIRGLGRMERLPKGERKLLAAIGQIYQRGGPVTEREAQQLAARYGTYQGYWAHYLRVAA
jgi:DNA-3-methyladenine glycosylase II